LPLALASEIALSRFVCHVIDSLMGRCASRSAPR
jgi:hypothetical protein